MLSGILNSDKANSMNIAIMRAFVEVRKVLLRENDLKEQMKQIKERLGEHDVQLNQIYDAMENLLVERADQRKLKERNRIGFRKIANNNLSVIIQKRAIILSIALFYFVSIFVNTHDVSDPTFSLKHLSAC